MAGRISYYGGIVKDGLVLDLDAGKRESYNRTGTSWNDVSGNQNNGTLVNGPTFNSSNGGGIVFDGIDDYLVSPNLNISGNVPITLNFWCNHLSNQASDVVSIFYGTCGSSYQCIGLYYRNSSNFVRFTTWQSSPGDYDTSFVKDFNVWHNWAIVYSNNTVSIYRDGVLDGNGSQSKTINFTSTKLSIGATISCGVQSNVNVSSAIVYNRPLSNQEILQNYNATKGRYL